MELLLQRSLRTVDEEGKPISDSSHFIVDLIKVEEFHNFVVDMVNEFGTDTKLMEGNKIGDIVYKKLKSQNLINENINQAFVDVLLAASVLHNLFYEEGDLTTLFKARQVLGPIATEREVPQELQAMLFQTIEAQLGDSTPVPMCRPVPNSPTSTFADAIWFAKYYKPQV
jgi:hypothetical protein